MNKIIIKSQVELTPSDAAKLAADLREYREQLRPIVYGLYRTLERMIGDPDGFDYMIGHLHCVTGDMQAIAREIDQAITAQAVEQEAQRAAEILTDLDAT